MSPTITLKGAIKFSIKKYIGGGEMTASEYKGPGEILMAPPFLGDITTLRMEEGKDWNIGKDAFLASTVSVKKEMKGQGNLGNAMLSGEGLFVYRISGTGILWISSFGAIVRKDVSQSSSTTRVYLIRILATSRGKVHRRQWSLSSLELRLRDGASG